MRRALTLFFVCCALAPWLQGCSPTPPDANVAKPELLPDAIDDSPLIVGNYLFWSDKSEQVQANDGLYPDRIHGYYLPTKEMFLVNDTPRLKTGIASDGRTLVWADYPEGDDDLQTNARIQGYDIDQRKEFTILDSLGTGSIGLVALENGVLYYSDYTPAHRGLWARTLATGEEQPIPMERAGGIPQRQVSHGKLIWAAREPQMKYVPIKEALHMRDLTSNNERILSAGRGEVRFAVSNDYIAWVHTRPSDDARVHAYLISMNMSQAVSKEDASSVAINNSYIAWSTFPSRMDSPYAIEVYNIADGRSTTVVEPDRGLKQVIGITDNNTLIYKLGDDKLYALKIAVEEKP
jgi:hypothetical protein